MSGEGISSLHSGISGRPLPVKMDSPTILAAFLLIPALMKPAIFFERDGVLNLVETRNLQQLVPKALEEFHLNPAARPVLLRLQQAGFLILVTTNQPGVSRGYLPRRELDRMHDMLRRELPID